MVEWWLSWPSRINSRWVPFVRLAVCLSKCLIQSRPTSLVVQPLSVVVIIQSAGRLLSVYQLARWYCAARMMNGGMAQPCAFTPWITVAHSRLPGCASLALPRSSEVVTTMHAKMIPIINPVLSDIQVENCVYSLLSPCPIVGLEPYFYLFSNDLSERLLQC
jgi:hypothetical protein